MHFNLQNMNFLIDMQPICYLKSIVGEDDFMNEDTVCTASDSPDALIRKYSSSVYRIAFSYTGNRNDAEDIMQEVFLRYLKKPRSFSSSEHEKAWFLRVAVNCSKSFHSTAWRRKVIPLEDCSELSSAADEGDTGLPVLEAVMALPPKQRLCIHLYYYEDLPIKEIAEASGIPESTVKSHLFRARASLEKTLRGDYHA